MHRDVTSGNVLLTEGAHARIADLGLAQRLTMPDSIVIAAPVEADSILMGTYGYVAPEYAMSGEHACPLLSLDPTLLCRYVIFSNRLHNRIVLQKPAPGPIH